MVDMHDPDTPRNRGDYDAPHLSPATPEDDIRTIMLNRVSWGAVLAGVVVSLVTQLILNLLGVGLGAAALDPAAGAGGNPSATGFSIGAGIWWALSGLIAAAAGGYTAGRLAGRPKESTAGWHGLTAWAFTTLLVFYLLTSTMGSIIGGAYRTVAGAAGTITSTAGGAVQTAATQVTDPFSSIERAVRGASGGNDPAALRDTAVTAVQAVVTGDPGQVQDARERAAQALAQAQSIPVDQARGQVQQYEQQYRQTVATVQQKATEAAEVAAEAVSRGALFGAIALILGAIASWFGGRMGAVEPTLSGRFGFGARNAGRNPA
jgi:hypothetical protein